MSHYLGCLTTKCDIIESKMVCGWLELFPCACIGKEIQCLLSDVSFQH